MRIFLTGASGFLGGELLPRLLAAGHEVWALSRSPLALAHDGLHDGLHEVRGDITLEHLGLDGPGPDGLDGVDAVVHLAALTSLGQTRPELGAMVNTLGTANVLAFALDRHAKSLHYASTLYIAGDHHGEFGEDDFFVAQHFKNPYERSKFLAELLLRAQELVPVSIYRLGILVGSADTGRASSFDSFYKPVGAIFAAQHIAEHKLKLPRRRSVEDYLGLPRLHIPIRIWGDPDSTMMLTPVDAAATLMGEAITQPLLPGGAYPRTLHVCPAGPVKNRLTAEAICEALEIDGFHFALEHREGLHAPLDMLYNRLVRDFIPYVESEPGFTTRTPTGPAIDAAGMARILTYYRQSPELRSVYGPESVTGQAGR